MSIYLHALVMYYLLVCEIESVVYTIHYVKSVGTREYGTLAQRRHVKLGREGIGITDNWSRDLKPISPFLELFSFASYFVYFHLFATYLLIIAPNFKKITYSNF